MDSTDPRERYARAMTAERDAWNEVKHTLPGSPDYDEDKWRRWRMALRAVAGALDDTRQARANQAPARDRPSR